jgi:hypothetical protein
MLPLYIWEKQKYHLFSNGRIVMQWFKKKCLAFLATLLFLTSSKSSPAILFFFRRPKSRTEFVHNGIRSTSTKKEPFELTMTLTKGPAHIAASRGFIDFILHDRRALKFREWVRDTGVPDETFFSSLNHNPQWGVPGSYKGTNLCTFNEKFFVL